MKHARIVNGKASDVTELNPENIYHPGLAAQFYAVNNGDAVNGSEIANAVFDEQAKTVTGDWTHFEPVVVAPIVATSFPIPKLDFKLRFTVDEWIAIKSIRETDARANYWLEIYDDPDFKNVDLLNDKTIELLDHLTGLSSPIIADETRKAEILATI